MYVAGVEAEDDENQFVKIAIQFCAYAISMYSMALTWPPRGPILHDDKSALIAMRTGVQCAWYPAVFGTSPVAL